MYKAPLIALCLMAGLSACSESDTDSAADMSRTIEADPTAAGSAMSECVTGIAMLKQQGAPEAAIHGLADCQQSGQQ